MNSSTPHDNRTLACLADARDSAAAILEWTSGVTFAEYQHRRQLRRAVEREFEIIGESLRRLRDANEETWEALPDARRIVAFRNRLAHGYDTVDDALVWGIVQDHLPQCVRELDTLLER